MKILEKNYKNKKKNKFNFKHTPPPPPTENRAMVQPERPHLAVRRRKYAIFMPVNNARIQVHAYNI